MPIHFAAARSASRSPVARRAGQTGSPPAHPMTTRAVLASAVSRPVWLGAALRHFAEHGLRAAEEAATMAEQAWRAGRARNLRVVDRGLLQARSQAGVWS